MIFVAIVVSVHHAAMTGCMRLAGPPVMIITPWCGLGLDYATRVPLKWSAIPRFAHVSVRTEMFIPWELCMLRKGMSFKLGSWIYSERQFHVHVLIAHLFITF